MNPSNPEISGAVHKTFACMQNKHKMMQTKIPKGKNNINKTQRIPIALSLKKFKLFCIKRLLAC